MIENMIEGRPFLYQAKEGIDGDKENYEPKGFLIRESVQLIVASPPKGVYRK
jgi:hypothetical protein